MDSKVASSKPDQPAGIEYVGLPGVTRPCVEAVERLLMSAQSVIKAIVLTHERDHALLLYLDEYRPIAVKSGFGSGYRGGGPHGFSRVLNLLDAHKVPVEEYQVESDFLERLDSSQLTESDLETLEESRRTWRFPWDEYVWEKHFEAAQDGSLWGNGPSVMPFSVINPKLMDLAIEFWKDPDARLVTAYRRLEDVVRERTGINETGSKLFSKAFLGSSAPLAWKNLDSAEVAGRANLFIGAFGAFRNRRAHREPKDGSRDEFLELMLVNLLFNLEEEAINPDAENREAT